MPVSYGRGFARKAAYTKKCSCDNPRWHGSHIEVNSRTDEITYILDCNNCKAYWASKSPEMRKYWDLDKRATSLWGYGDEHKETRTYRECFRELDEKRLETLELFASCRDRDVINAQKEAERAHRAVEKYKAMMEDFE